MVEERNRKVQIKFYYPSEKFPSISVTGTECSLNCKHCNSFYLKRMIPAASREELLSVCKNLERKGAIGCLISGGCNSSGKVPIPYDALKKLNEETKLVFNIHPGLVTEKEAKQIQEAKVRYVSIDIVADEKVCYEIYGLKKSPLDYEKSLKLLTEIPNIRVCPHICVGLYYGKISHEYKSLRLIEKFKDKIAVLVLLVLMPTFGTELENVKLEWEDILEFIRYCREKLPENELSLGCMRPKPRFLEEEAVEIFDRIAIPSRVAIEKAKKLGKEILERETCCVID